jgi:hypothetical protein
MLLTKQQLRAHVMASEDPERFALTHLKVQPSGRVSATNGHLAVIVTPKHKMDEGEFPEVPGLRGAEPEADVMIPVEMARAAEKIVPTVKDMPLLSMARLLVSDRAMIGATDLETPHLVTEQRAQQTAFDFKFPDIEVVMPTEAPIGTVLLKAEYIERIAKYARAFAIPSGGVKLSFYGAGKAVRFAWSDDQHDVEGVLMPMRDDVPE